jgi:hypothetical protein
MKLRCLNHKESEYTNWFDHFNVLEEDKRMMLDQDTMANVYSKRGMTYEIPENGSRSRRHTIKYYRALPIIVKDEENDKLLEELKEIAIAYIAIAERSVRPLRCGKTRYETC